MAEKNWDPSPDPEYIQYFLSDLSEIIREYSLTEDARNRKTAEKFSPFRYIRLDENMTSCILADLLNPAGEHGQGRLFLDIFLELCSLDKSFFPDAAPVFVKCEATTHSISNSLRRIDILLTSRSSSLAVENKIWAGDQNEQALDYLRHLQKTVQGDFRLAYLAPAGKHLSEYSLPMSVRAEFQNSFCSVPWQRLLLRLEQCAPQIEAEKLRFFLNDFIAAMNETLGFSMEGTSCHSA